MDTGETAGRYDNQVTVETFKPEEAPAEPVEKVEAPVENTEEKPEEPEAPKKRNGYKEKLEKVRQENAELKARLESSAPKEEPKGKPNWDDYASKGKTYEDYYEDLADWKIDQKTTQKESKSKEDALRKEAEAKRDAFRSKAEVFSKNAPDFEAAIEEAGLAEVPGLGAVLMESDFGPEIAYHLAKNPDDAEKLDGMTYTQMTKFIGRLEAKFEGDEPAPKPEVRISKAPPPIVPVGKSANTETYNPYSAQGKDDHDAYMKWRAQQKR